jgi:parvulin-like peptidyl-prolyl cis-trans isomerase-like protein
VRNLSKEPLLYFLIAGALLFLLDYSINARQKADPRSIVVDKPSLLSFFQAREKIFDPEASIERFEAMATLERKRLVNEYIREEALYREALSIGLNRNDALIKNRLIQKMEFIAEDLSTSLEKPPTRKTLEDYFELHRIKYYIQPVIIFTHVYFDTEQRSETEARDRSIAELAILRRSEVPFHQAIKYGDRFPLHSNYVNRGPDFIASHFGKAFASDIFDSEVASGQWYGPVKSSHGYHLVLIKEKTGGHHPVLDDIYDKVRQDYARDNRRKNIEIAIQEIVKKYHVERREE